MSKIVYVASQRITINTVSCQQDGKRLYRETSINDTTGTTVSCPVYGGVLISEVPNIHMAM